MKILKNLFVISLILLLSNCDSADKEKDNANLWALKLLTKTSGHTSVLYMEQIDPFTYGGYCLDNFSPLTGVMTADDYYTAHAAPTTTMGINQKYKLSKKKCSDLKFSGGYTIRDTDGISFDKYVCGPQGSHCDNKAVLEAGFKI